MANPTVRRYFLPILLTVSGVGAGYALRCWQEAGRATPLVPGVGVLPASKENPSQGRKVSEAVASRSDNWAKLLGSLEADLDDDMLAHWEEELEGISPSARDVDQLLLKLDLQSPTDRKQRLLKQKLLCSCLGRIGAGELPATADILKKRLDGRALGQAASWLVANALDDGDMPAQLVDKFGPGEVRNACIRVAMAGVNQGNLLSRLEWATHLDLPEERAQAFENLQQTLTRMPSIAVAELLAKAEGAEKDYVTTLASAFGGAVAGETSCREAIAKCRALPTGAKTAQHSALLAATHLNARDAMDYAIHEKLDSLVGWEQTITMMTYESPREAAKMIESLSDIQTASRAASVVVAQWITSDSLAASAWAEQQPSPIKEASAAAIAKYLREKGDVVGAREWDTIGAQE